MTLKVPAPSDTPQLPAAEFHCLADVPPEVEWFANLTSPNTRRAYENAVRDFMIFAGIERPEDSEQRRARMSMLGAISCWGTDWAEVGSVIASLALLFQYRGQNAVTHNPVKGLQRPEAETAEGKTTAIGDYQARALLAAPIDDSVRGKCDRAFLSTLLFHALRRDELCKLKVKEFWHARKGVAHLKVSGKCGKTHWLTAASGDERGRCATTAPAISMRRFDEASHRSG